MSNIFTDQFLTVHCPVGAHQHVVTPTGHPYSASPGNPIFVPADDAMILAGWGWILGARGNPLVTEGGSAGRPASPAINDRYLDHDVGMQIFWDGANWRDPITGAAV
ncbi:hypothetical protein WK11_25465 [Burkholderia ubonensis]|uniref:hypothetical protein n=1 Tax=Burkholderia ubonensis TaxID=101571 RepID=UPI0007520FC5|nr:hypothetical protein [Burkholderia ubonensis]KVD37864.1 hypothetical protein WI83_06785 [Burkholderia ubonensis]KVH67820.1 hypothetical protein WJ41_22785 [Burkholderia ubonensis]KVN95472.1 hypothetical protein WJ69_04665 [Burkholderia ubonensis]KVR16122.1 hypothetical protein WK11_25465 [Burkholderia ubonensis]KVT99741.1 hypothetical protein WK61_07640 [Burkholderia ubonensis]